MQRYTYLEVVASDFRNSLPVRGWVHRDRGRERCAVKSLRVVRGPVFSSLATENTGHQQKRENSFPSTRTFLVPGTDS